MRHEFISIGLDANFCDPAVLMNLESVEINHIQVRMCVLSYMCMGWDDPLYGTVCLRDLCNIDVTIVHAYTVFVYLLQLFAVLIWSTIL